MVGKIPEDAHFFDVLGRLIGAAARVSRVASTLEDVGMERPAEKLYHAAEEIHAIRDWLRERDMRDVQQRYDEAQKDMGNILTALMSGLEIGKREA